MSWSQNLLLTSVPVALIVLFMGGTFLEQTPKILALCGLLYGRPLAGVGAVDYFLLRRQRISLRGLYDTSRDAPYYYRFGFNPAGILAGSTPTCCCSTRSPSTRTARSRGLRCPFRRWRRAR